MELTHLSQLERMIEQQVQESIIGTVHVWADQNSYDDLIETCSSISGITHNPNLFVKHEINENLPKESYYEEMATCFPRIIIAIIFDSVQNPKLLDWVNTFVPETITKVPFANIVAIDSSKPSTGTLEFMNKYQVINNPTILVFKMGYLIDKFIPLVLGVNDSETIHDKRNLMDPLLAAQMKIDPGQADYEERMRKKAIEEEEKKRVADLLEKKRIAEKIKQYRKDKD